MFERDKLDIPVLTAIIEYNGLEACKALGIPLRNYPLFLPLPYTILKTSPELQIEKTQGVLSIHGELALIVGRDIEKGECGKARDAIAGYCMGIGIHDSSMVDSCVNPTPRDTGINRWYGYFRDGSRIQGKDVLSKDELQNIKKISLQLTVGNFGEMTYDQGNLLYSGEDILEMMSKITPFRRGDIICLGPANAPVKLAASQIFKEGKDIVLRGEPFSKLTVKVQDNRSSS